MSPAPWAAVSETHSGAVFFVGDRAYKLKKPVSLGFLDFTRREAREAACHREVELNRRLAPDVYEGVVDVVGEDGVVVDHLVVMRRLPDDRRLAALAVSGTDLADQVHRIARVLAAFHAAAHTSTEIASAASRDAMSVRWEQNFSELDRFVGDLLDPVRVGRAAELARRYLRGRGPLFEARAAAGRARDGHGDLLADDIFCLDDGPRILDCIEFDDTLRWGDVLGDVAFLAMDLERIGRPDLAGALLGDYRELTGDSWPASLAHHHVAHRALIRAKVTCVRSAQGDADAAEAARHLLDLTVQHLAAGRVQLVVVGGLPGTGKSTLAGGIGDVLGAVVLRSDVVRKELVGADSGAAATPDDGEVPFGHGIYTAETTDLTYGELVARARIALSHGESVVLDASWHDAARRKTARDLARETVADLTEIHCVAPLEITVARLTARAVRGGDPSDATPSVSHAMAAVEAAWPEAVELDTTGTEAATLGVVRARLEG